MAVKNDKAKRVVWLSIAALLSVVVLAAIFINRDDSVQSVPAHQPINEPQQTPANRPPEKTQEVSEKLTKDDLETEILSQELREELDWVAEAYEQQAKYPVTSRLVTDVDLARSAEPFEEAQVDMQLPDEDGELSPVLLSASVDKISYFKGDPITIRLMVSGTEGNENVAVSANIKQSGTINLLPADIDLSDVTGDQKTFIGNVDSSTFNTGTQASELMARISVEIDADSYVTTVPFMFSQASARLDNVALSRPDGAYLKIPLEYSVSQAGYYFVSAFLDDAATGRPLLQLETEGTMNQGNGRLDLKAHHQALKDAGSQGPYRLRVVRSFRGALPGEGDDVPTAISQSEYPIPGYDFENYDDIPYSDPDVEERLEALRGLTGGSG